jgi:hypothetical protein
MSPAAAASKMDAEDISKSFGRGLDKRSRKKIIGDILWPRH